YIALSLFHRIVRVAPDGTVDIVAGSGVAGYSGDGGPALSAQLNGPVGLAADANGLIYIADTGNNVIRPLSPSGIITTVAGNGQSGFSGDNGPAIAARLNGPAGVLPDGTSGFFIADTLSHRVRRVAPDGTISTYAGGASGFGGDGGAPGSALFNQ